MQILTKTQTDMKKTSLTIKVSGNTPDESKRAAIAALKIYNASIGQISLEEFEQFAQKIKEKPSLIKTAKSFL